MPHFISRHFAVGILAVSFLAIAASNARAQTQYSIGSPINEAQYMLELINRARANGATEAARLGLSSLQEGPPNYNGEIWTITNTNQPLSWNSMLQNSAQNQATNLNSGDQFFLGVSPHTYGGLTPQQRIAAAGYSMATYTGPTTSPSHFYPGPENIAEAESQGSGPYTGTKLINAVLSAHNDLFTDLNTSSRGHRSTMMLGFFRETGIGVSVGTDNSQNPGQPGGAWNSLYIVQDYGTRTNSTPFITGVVYHDLNGNRFYDPGEGIGGVRVDVTGSNYYAITSASGGYSVPVPTDGSYPMTFSDGNVVTVHATAVVSGFLNSKVDYLAQVLAPLAGVARSSNAFVVSFNAVAGQSYRLERTTSLTLPNYQPINGVNDFTASTTGAAQLSDPNAFSLGQSFYRIRILP